MSNCMEIDSDSATVREDMTSAEALHLLGVKKNLNASLMQRIKQLEQELLEISSTKKWQSESPDSTFEKQESATHFDKQMPSLQNDFEIDCSTPPCSLKAHLRRGSSSAAVDADALNNNFPSSSSSSSVPPPSLLLNGSLTVVPPVTYEVSHNVLVVEEKGVCLQKLQDLIGRFYGRDFANPYFSDENTEDEGGLVSFGTAHDIFSRMHGYPGGGSGSGSHSSQNDIPENVAKSFCSVERLMNPTTSSAQKIIDLLHHHYSLYQDENFATLKDISVDYADTLLQLCARAKVIIQGDPLFLRLESPIYVMGDIHGSFGDLQFFLQHLLNFGQLAYTASKLLFLGDYVDRGVASLEVIATLLAMKCLAPDSIFLLRGNHETAAVNANVSVYGKTSFLYQCCVRFGDDVGRQVNTAFNGVFAVMPLAAEVDKAVFCVHGGIPQPDFDNDETYMDALTLLDSPSFPRLHSVISTFEDDEHTTRCKQIALGLLWSDPAGPEANLDNFGFGSNLQRGEGAYVFGAQAMEAFSEETHYQYIIRAHEVKQQGLRLCQSGKVITVFTASSYCGGDNAAGAVYLAKGKIRMISCIHTTLARKSTLPMAIPLPDSRGGGSGGFGGSRWTSDNTNNNNNNNNSQSKDANSFHTCDQCGEILSTEELDEHSTNCPADVESCTRCGENVPRFALEKHSETCDTWQ